MRLGAFFFEILPLAGFFIAFHYLGLLPAAAISVGLGMLVLLFARLRERRTRCGQPRWASLLSKDAIRLICAVNLNVPVNRPARRRDGKVDVIRSAMARSSSSFPSLSSPLRSLPSPLPLSCSLLPLSSTSLFSLSVLPLCSPSLFSLSVLPLCSPSLLPLSSPSLL